MTTELIERDEVKRMLDAGEDFKLVFCLGEAEYSLKHIPGSLCLSDPSELESHLDQGDNIVVYCSGPDCLASAIAYELMVRSGFENVRRYAGGVYEWEEAGYSLEGSMIPEGDHVIKGAPSPSVHSASPISQK
jgi:hydroxyacylglutathione hydrolase